MSLPKLQTIGVVVAGTGYEGRAAVIRRHCREGMPVDLRREPDNPHDPDAIGVWLQCPTMLGLLRPWKKVGYVKAPRAGKWAALLDDGSMQVTRAIVRSFYAPDDNDYWPRISLEVDLARK